MLSNVNLHPAYTEAAAKAKAADKAAAEAAVAPPPLPPPYVPPPKDTQPPVITAVKKKLVQVDSPISFTPCC